ncbi:MAG: SpoIIE family protein phosphatase [Acidobacteria bacterium]|nr:SpoIIE family protein phosphatase [Acidobacteriota bacterium]
MNASFALSVSEPSLVGEARRAMARLARTIGCSEHERGRAELVVTELATNLARHAGGGEVLMRALDGEGPGLEVLALDRGPGMADIAACLRDGFSTTGSPGTGLGAVQRLVDEFALHSKPGVGTAILARLFLSPAPAARRVDLGAVCVALRGEQVSGDAWAEQVQGPRLRLALVDGLGHGADAAAAARAAIETFRAQGGRSPAEIVERMHEALRATRGAAAAVAELDANAREVRYAGVGNTVGVISDGEWTRNMVSMNGTLGHAIRRVTEYSYPWPQGALVVLHSDGIGRGWQIGRYAGLAAKPAALIAGVLYRDFARGRDDASVLVARAR